MPDAPARPSGLIPLHLAGSAFVQSTSLAVQAILPVLAIKQFGAGEWGSLFITASPTVFYSLSIFWGDLLRHRSLGTYLLIFWLVSALPLAAIAFAHDYYLLLIPHLISCVGGAGYPPVTGELLQALYPPATRGRMYSITWGSTAIITAALSYAFGEWQSRDPDAFRYFIPIAVACQGLGSLTFIFLARRSGHAARRPVHPPEPRGHWAKVADPVLHMGRTLKADPAFARYEAAYMTYGVGWMIAYALLPVLVTKKLHLDYDAIALNSQVAYLVALVAALVPAGLMLDRLGPVRTAGLSFLMLAGYPIGLLLVRNTSDLALVSLWFGLAHSGASVGWTLGPVSLAPSPDKVPAYLAIHATMVGIRGKLFQGLGVLLFWLTQSFTWPLVVAALAYVWAAWQMWQLNRFIADRRPAPPPPDA